MKQTKVFVISIVVANYISQHQLPHLNHIHEQIFCDGGSERLTFKLIFDLKRSFQQKWVNGNRKLPRFEKRFPANTET